MTNESFSVTDQDYLNFLKDIKSLEKHFKVKAYLTSNFPNKPTNKNDRVLTIEEAEAFFNGDTE